MSVSGESNCKNWGVKEGVLKKRKNNGKSDLWREIGRFKTAKWC